MVSFSLRRLAPACGLVAAVAALAAPGAASALGTQCSGANILGKGSSAQSLGHEKTWGPEFNKALNSTACSGPSGGKQGSEGTPTVTYEKSGSGAGMQLWGLEKEEKHQALETGTYSFVGTDEPPNTSQKAEIEHFVGTTIFTEPVTQFAVAADIHLPKGCQATSEPKKKHPEGRLVLSAQTLEKIFQGTIVKWNEITEGKDELEPISPETCNSAAKIQRVVRLDESGTTHVFKKFLSLADSGKYLTEKGGATEYNWDQLSESTENTNWPKGNSEALPVTTSTEEGGSKLVAKVASTESSIGYAALSDSRNNENFDGKKSGGPGTEKFWAEIQNNTSAQPKYADPATNGDEKELGNSNCEKVKYTNGAGKKFPPKKASESWSEVTTSLKQSKYPICGLTYDLLMKEYSKAPGTTEKQVQTVHDYFTFVFNEGAGGGQPLIENKDYFRLPTKLVKESDEGLAQVTY
jgi:ABC-type phosphate transport system substrate-binding protein